MLANTATLDARNVTASHEQHGCHKQQISGANDDLNALCPHGLAACAAALPNHLGHLLHHCWVYALPCTNIVTHSSID